MLIDFSRFVSSHIEATRKKQKLRTIQKLYLPREVLQREKM